MKIIMDIRSRIADKILKEERLKDYEKCKSDENKVISDFCLLNFADLPTKYKNCITSRRNYCFYCCEENIGTIHLLERNDCYENCDEMIDLSKIKLN